MDVPSDERLQYNCAAITNLESVSFDSSEIQLDITFSPETDTNLTSVKDVELPNICTEGVKANSMPTLQEPMKVPDVNFSSVKDVDTAGIQVHELNKDGIEKVNVDSSEDENISLDLLNKNKDVILAYYHNVKSNTDLKKDELEGLKTKNENLRARIVFLSERLNTQYTNVKTLIEKRHQILKRNATANTHLNKTGEEKTGLILTAESHTEVSRALTIDSNKASCSKKITNLKDEDIICFKTSESNFSTSLRKNLKEMRKSVPVSHELESYHFVTSHEMSLSEIEELTCFNTLENLTVLGTTNSKLIIFKSFEKSNIKLDTPNIVTHVDFIGQNEVVIGCNNGVLSRLTILTGTITNLYQHVGKVTGVRVHPSKKYASSSGLDGKWTVVNIQEKRLVKLVDTGYELWALDVHPNGIHVATSSKLGIELWNLLQQERVWLFDGSNVNSLNFLPQGSFLCYGQTNGSVYLLKTSNPPVLQSSWPISELHKKNTCISLDISGTYACQFVGKHIRFLSTHSRGKTDYEYELNEICSMEDENDIISTAFTKSAKTLLTITKEKLFVYTCCHDK